MENIAVPNNLNFENVWAMFQDVAQRFKDTDKKFEDTKKMFQDTDKRFKEIHDELGGIGKSNGEIAEDFFYKGLEANMKVADLHFDYIDRNLHRKRNNTEAEYDIILYNNYKVLVVEIKYNFRMKQLRDFYTDKLKRFRSLFPEYSKYKLYGAVAALTFDKNVVKEAQEYGFYVLSQNNDKIKLLNQQNFEPNDVK